MVSLKDRIVILVCCFAKIGLLKSLSLLVLGFKTQRNSIVVIPTSDEISFLSVSQDGLCPNRSMIRTKGEADRERWLNFGCETSSYFTLRHYIRLWSFTTCVTCYHMPKADFWDQEFRQLCCPKSK